MWVNQQPGDNSSSPMFSPRSNRSWWVNLKSTSSWSGETPPLIWHHLFNMCFAHLLRKSLQWNEYDKKTYYHTKCGKERNTPFDISQHISQFIQYQKLNWVDGEKVGQVIFLALWPHPSLVGGCGGKDQGSISRTFLKQFALVTISNTTLQCFALSLSSSIVLTWEPHNLHI